MSDDRECMDCEPYRTCVRCRLDAKDKEVEAAGAETAALRQRVKELEGERDEARTDAVAKGDELEAARLNAEEDSRRCATLRAEVTRLRGVVAPTDANVEALLGVANYAGNRLVIRAVLRHFTARMEPQWDAPVATRFCRRCCRHDGAVEATCEACCVHGVRGAEEPARCVVCSQPVMYHRDARGGYRHCKDGCPANCAWVGFGPVRPQGESGQGGEGGGP